MQKSITTCPARCWFASNSGDWRLGETWHTNGLRQTEFCHQRIWSTVLDFTMQQKRYKLNKQKKVKKCSVPLLDAFCFSFNNSNVKVVWKVYRVKKHSYGHTALEPVSVYKQITCKSLHDSSVIIITTDLFKKPPQWILGPKKGNSDRNSFMKVITAAEHAQFFLIKHPNNVHVKKKQKTTFSSLSSSLSMSGVDTLPWSWPCVASAPSHPLHIIWHSGKFMSTLQAYILHIRRALQSRDAHPAGDRPRRAYYVTTI